MKTNLSVIALAVSISLGAQAQTLPGPLVEAARKAVASNPEVQAKWHGFQAAGNERDVARAGYLPQVDLRAGVGHESRVTPTADLGSYSTRGVALTLNQMLFDGRFTPNEVKRLGFAKLTRYYELAEASETVSLEAVRAYADVVRYRELLEVAKSNYVEHKRTTNLVEERANAGVGRRVDVEQAVGRLALAESNLLTELTNLHDVSARYLRVVGEKPPANLPGLPENFKLGTMPVSTDVLMREGLPGSPTLNAAMENVRAMRTAIDTRQAANMPRVDLRAFTNRDRNLLGTNGSTRVNGVEVVLNYNLYRGGADMARERQAVDLHEQARDLKEKACRDVRQTLSIAYSDVNSLNLQLRHLDQHRLSTEKSREAYRQQFELGQRTLLDLLDSQNEYFQATRSYINARYNQALAQARTLSGMGQLVPALSVRRADMPSAQDAGQDRTSIDPSELCPIEDTLVDSLEKIKAELVILPRTRPVPVATPVAPAPAPAPVPMPAKLSFSADALFDFDKSDLKPEGQASLSALVEQVKGANVEMLVAVGHTDSVGSDDYNMRLSLARARAVKTYLVSLGISQGRIQTEGRGESQPVADNKTAEGRAKNRRVDIEVTQAAGR